MVNNVLSVKHMQFNTLRLLEPYIEVQRYFKEKKMLPKFIK